MNAEFHHLGVACSDIDAAERQQRRWGYRREGDDFEDPEQGVRGRFLVGGGPRLELLEALPGHRVLDPWLAGGDRVYHQAYTVPDVDAGLAELVGERARVVSPPRPAVAFAGRRVAFAVLRTLLLVELVEAGPQPPPADALGRSPATAARCG